MRVNNENSGLADSVNSHSDSVTSTSPQTRWHRASKYFWGPDPVNKLGHSYFASPKTHTILRYVFMAFHLLTVIWTFIDIQKWYWVFGYLTLWGFFFCTIYFSLVNFVKHSHHSRKRWRFVYVLGEIAATMEIVICLAFWSVLFPYFLSKTPSIRFIILQTLLHLVCPIMIWIETFLNALEFPKRHMWFIIVVMIAYLPVNCIYTLYVIPDGVYFIMTWKDIRTPIFIAASALLAILAYYCGFWQHQKKKDRPFMKPKTANQDIVTKLI